MSLTHSETTYRLAVSAISPLFLNRFGRSLWVYHLEFNKKAEVKMPDIDGGLRILCDFIELSYCDPFGPW